MIIIENMSGCPLKENVVSLKKYNIQVHVHWRLGYYNEVWKSYLNDQWTICTFAIPVNLDFMYYPLVSWNDQT